LVGESVGHIRIVDVLSRGGMGTVYVGEDETLQRRVAVKAIRGEHRMHEQAKARFLREARILSQVNHHNICVVHDFIESEDSDYLVLELVPGRNLRAAMRTQLSERQKLEIAKQLLEVLVEVHGAGVVHRDLKPENIMVKPDGRITILDFGLARSVDEDAAMYPGVPTLDLEDLEAQAESTESPSDSESLPSVLVKTNQGTVIGTAGYMSPEQAMSEPATAASDVYSAGLILQELFTGSPPFEQGLSPAGMVIKAAGGESRPVTGLAADLTALIERLKAVAPGARPSAMDALDQLQRIIDKPKRRRKRAMIAAVWIALAALAVGMTIQSLRASREAKRANREAIAAKNVSDFLVNLFEEANPEQARGASLTAEEILDRGAKRITDDLEDQPLTQARLLMTIGRVYGKMGLYSEAIPFFENAVGIREQELGDEHAEVADALDDLGDTLRRIGEFERAEIHLKRSLEMRQRIFGPDHLKVGNSHQDLGMFLSDVGRFDEADVHHRRALAIYESERGPDHVDTSKTLGNIAILLARQGRVEEAEPTFRRVLAIQEKTLGADHMSVFEARNNLAIALKILGRYEESEELYKVNLEIQQRVLGEDHPEVGATLQNYANLFAEMGRFDEAEPLYLASLEIKRSALGSDHPEVALALGNLGSLYIEQKRWAEAESMCLHAIAIQEEVLDPGHPGKGLNQYNLALAYQNQGRDSAAEKMFESSLSILSRAFPPNHRHRVLVVEGYASFLRENGREEEAREIEAQEASS